MDTKALFYVVAVVIFLSDQPLLNEVDPPTEAESWYTCNL